MQNIPKSIDQVTEQFLRSVLQPYPFAQHITSFAVEADSQGRCSCNVRVTLHYHEAASLSSSQVEGTKYPTSLFVKIAAPVPEGDTAALEKRKTLAKTGIYRREVAFCKVLNSIRSLAPYVPHIYYAAIDEKSEHGDFVIVMQDLGKSGNQQLGCTDEEAETILKSWAHVQAAFWNLSKEECEKYHLKGHLFEYLYKATFFGTDDSVDCSYTEANVDKVVESIVAKWDGFVQVTEYVEQYFATNEELKDCSLKSVTKALNSNAEECKAKLATNLKKALEALCTSTNHTLLHCDFRLDNMVFGNGQEHAKFFDFQSVCVGNCSYDIGQFMMQCLTKEQVSKLYKPLLTSYLNILHESPSINEAEDTKTYIMEQFMEDFRHSIMLQVLYIVNVFGTHWKPLADNKLDFPMVMGRFFSMVTKLADNIVTHYRDWFM